MYSKLRNSLQLKLQIFLKWSIYNTQKKWQHKTLLFSRTESDNVQKWYQHSKLLQIDPKCETYSISWAEYLVDFFLNMEAQKRKLSSKYCKILNKLKLHLHWVYDLERNITLMSKNMRTFKHLEEGFVWKYGGYSVSNFRDCVKRTY